MLRPHLSRLSLEEKDALILALLDRVAALEAKLNQPPKTPDNSSVPPSLALLQSSWPLAGCGPSEGEGRHFEGEIALWAVRWYCRYGVSYRDLEQMMSERGVSVDHSTIYRWVQRYAPEIEKRLRWRWRRPGSLSWRVDETYIKVKGEWAYLYRTADKLGNTIDFYLSPTRNTKAACAKRMQSIKRDVPKSAYATIKGFEVMRALRKGQAAIFNITRDIPGEARLVERASAPLRWRKVMQVVSERLELEAA